MPRLRHYDHLGTARFVTFCCYHRYQLLTDSNDIRAVLGCLDGVCRKDDIRILGYFIMPEHVHLLIWPRQESYRMDRFLYDCKRPVSCKAKRWLQESGELEWLERLSVSKGTHQRFRFWQAGGGYDRNLIRDDRVGVVIEYIHGNPVRRGLVDAPEDWRWSTISFPKCKITKNLAFRMDQQTGSSSI